MNKQTHVSQGVAAVAAGDSGLAARLRQELQGDVLFDAFSRGRYSTDASIYQIQPIGVVVPQNEQDVQRALQVAVDAGLPVLHVVVALHRPARQSARP